jgi:hypothetical protein
MPKSKYFVLGRWGGALRPDRSRSEVTGLQHRLPTQQSKVPQECNHSEYETAVGGHEIKQILYSPRHHT